MLIICELIVIKDKNVMKSKQELVSAGRVEAKRTQTVIWNKLRETKYFDIIK